LKLEACRKTIKGRQEIVFVLVDPVKLSEAGITEEEPKRYVKDLLEEMGKFMGDAVVESLGGSGTHRPEGSKESRPAWLSQVFPSGIPLEIVVIEKDGSRRTESLLLPTTSPR
jgi:hypothetical protein